MSHRASNTQPGTNRRPSSKRVRRRRPVVTFKLARRYRPRMDMNQIIALLFAFLMVTSMIAWGALYIF